MVKISTAQINDLTEELPNIRIIIGNEVDAKIASSQHTAGSGLALTGKAFNIKVDPASTSGILSASVSGLKINLNNYLTVTGTAASAATAVRLAVTRDINVSGAVVGTVQHFDGTDDIIIPTTLAIQHPKTILANNAEESAAPLAIDYSVLLEAMIEARGVEIVREDLGLDSIGNGFIPTSNPGTAPAGYVPIWIEE
jgi:hypothetical protein